MNKNIFCIVGKSGAGKSYYIDSIRSDSKFMKQANLSPLVYGTTREKRAGEKDGIDYNFVTEEQYKNINPNNLIETRTYGTISGIKYYFTKSDYIKNPKSNLICTSSLYQYESYRNWTNLENLTNKSNSIDEKYILNIIIINSELKTRLKRIIDRSTTDKEIYEGCRRVVEEKSEFESVESRVPELMDPMIYPQVLIIDNNDFANTENNLIKIKEFILSKI